MRQGKGARGSGRTLLGRNVGSNDGKSDGENDGTWDGEKVGVSVGTELGASVGSNVVGVTAARSHMRGCRKHRPCTNAAWHGCGDGRSVTCSDGERLRLCVRVTVRSRICESARRRQGGAPVGVRDGLKLGACKDGWVPV